MHSEHLGRAEQLPNDSKLIISRRAVCCGSLTLLLTHSATASVQAKQGSRTPKHYPLTHVYQQNGSHRKKTLLWFCCKCKLRFFLPLRVKKDRYLPGCLDRRDNDDLEWVEKNRRMQCWSEKPQTERKILQILSLKHQLFCAGISKTIRVNTLWLSKYAPAQDLNGCTWGHTRNLW